MNINDIKRRGERSIISKTSVAEYLVIPPIAALISVVALLWIWELFGY